MKEKEFSIIFPEYYDELYEFESEQKGYLNDVLVQLESGMFSLNFYDIYRLKEDFESEIELGANYYFEPNLIIIDKVNKLNINNVIFHLYKNGAFQKMKKIK